MKKISSLIQAYDNFNSHTSRSNLFRAAIVYFCGGTYLDAKTESPEGFGAVDVLSTVFSDDIHISADRNNPGHRNSAFARQEEERDHKIKNPLKLESGDIGFCLDPGWQVGSVKAKVMDSFFATYPRNPALLYVIMSFSAVVVFCDFYVFILEFMI